MIMEGAAALAILGAANNLCADAIVLGTHSQRWLEAFVLGSVTEKVLHHTSLPLFIIPTKQQA